MYEQKFKTMKCNFKIIAALHVSLLLHLSMSFYLFYLLSAIFKLYVPFETNMLIQLKHVTFVYYSLLIYLCF